MRTEREIQVKLDDLIDGRENFVGVQLKETDAEIMRLKWALGAEDHIRVPNPEGS